jgi:signal peptidase I
LSRRNSRKKTAPEKAPTRLGLWWARFSRWRRRRRELGEGKEAAKEIRRVLRRRLELDPAVRRDAENALRIWDEMRRGKDASADLHAGAAELVRLLEGPLAEHRRHPAWGYAFSFLIAASFALFLRAFVFEPFRIPSGSMVPTLQVGDYIYVNKFVYGLRIPFTDDPPKHFVMWSLPERGDVVVFIEPIHNSEDWIKRVIGLPGDRIRFRDRTIYYLPKGETEWRAVRNRKLDEPCAYMDRNEKLNEDWHPGNPCELYEERLGSRTWRVIYDVAPRQLPMEFPSEWEVPGHCVFVMGDNRDNSEDSRFLTKDGQPAPCVPLENLKGRAEFIWLSPGPDGQRWGRLFTGVR